LQPHWFPDVGMWPISALSFASTNFGSNPIFLAMLRFLACPQSHRSEELASPLDLQVGQTPRSLYLSILSRQVFWGWGCEAPFSWASNESRNVLPLLPEEEGMHEKHLLQKFFCFPFPKKTSLWK
jgi:hypothetical protein